MQEEWIDSGNKVQTGPDSDGNFSFSKIQYNFDEEGLIKGVRLKRVEEKSGILGQTYFKELE